MTAQISKKISSNTKFSDEWLKQRHPTSVKKKEEAQQENKEVIIEITRTQTIQRRQDLKARFKLKNIIIIIINIII